ncbi:hypothetical protein OSB04_020663 [Centaurea solstitialis]|uniref:glutathione transferase n=1 Tax=Centaurea solstitialis TaxID=347529 RepID=A0AA38WDH3_9ASTR|nr:hypothetical protein OSB04_020663 [Centaurea solstitialis]
MGFPVESNDEKMVDEVKLLGTTVSPYVWRVKIALHIKGIKYQILEEDLHNKSSQLVNYNPLYKKVPVLVHNGNPVSESLVIVEYIDNVWKQVPLLPQDPYQQAVARLWTKFIDEKCVPVLHKVFGKHGGEQVVAKACKNLQMLENELGARGNKFFGGDNMNMIDIFVGFIAYWLPLLEEATEMKIFTEDKFPNIMKWVHEFVNFEVVKEILPPREAVLAYYNKWFRKG